MRIEEPLDLTPYNSYGIRAFCARGVFPETEADLVEAYGTYPHDEIMLVGSGHNVILSREWYDETFILLNNTFDDITVDGTRMHAQSGAFSTRMSEVALEHGLTGLEFFYDIPSSLGGAVVMNAGASGEDIAGVLEAVRYLNLSDGTVHTLHPSEANFGYRQSLFQGGARKVVLSADLRLSEGDPNAIQTKMETMRDARWAKQPRDFPNAGSVFKRPPGFYVGTMIEELGLKGRRVGGAMISDQHAGIFVNCDGATGPDVIALLEEARQRVKEIYGVDLEPEQIIL